MAHVLLQCAEAAALESRLADDCDEPDLIGEEHQSSELDDVVRRCEEISASLKSKLGAVTGYCRSDTAAPTWHFCS